MSRTSRGESSGEEDGRASSNASSAGSGDEDADGSGAGGTDPYSPPRERRKLVGEPELWKVKREFQFEFLRSRGIEEDDFLLDLGCGTLRGGIPLIDYLEPRHYFGVEKRYEALVEGMEELARHGLEQKRPILMTIDRTEELEFIRSFDWIWAYSVLFHMKDRLLDQYLSFIARHLEPDGRFYANVEAGDREDESWRDFPVIWRTVEEYGDLAAGYGMVVEDLGTLRSLGQDSGLERDDRQRMLEFRLG